MTKPNLEKFIEDESLLKLAFTHKSWVNENTDETESNERLEFLGDAVLEFIVSKELYKRFPKKEEGYLTTLRANLVNTVNLAEVAKKLKLGESLYLSKGEEEGGGRKNPSILANTFEAVVGAIYLDKGIRGAEKFITDNLLEDLADKISKPLKDAKSRLQEIVQAQGLPAPRYDVIEEKGPDHNKKFTVEAVVNGEALAKGEGKNKSEAAQQAASRALKRFL